MKDSLAAGGQALSRGDWTDARGQFEGALEAEKSGEAWEGLGWAGWWLADEELTFRARQSAFRAYRDAGDPASAARVAAWIAADFREFRGEEAVGQGWLERARRLLANVPEGADHGWLAVIECDFALNVDGDPERAVTLASYAAELGRGLGVPDLEALGLALEGSALVLRGQVDEGMRRLDEASAIAAGEDLHLPVTPAWAFCCLIFACDGVGDFPRAAQWCDIMRRFSERWGGRQIMGVCRSAYGRVLATRGDWTAAEGELTAAVEDLQAARPGMASAGLVRLGELRARQGRSDEARALFEQAGAAGLVGLGELALDDGDAAGAVDAAERVLRQLHETDVLDRLPPLELLVRARADLDELEAARTAFAELTECCATVGTPYVLARSRLVAGELAVAGGHHDEARRAFEDAVDSFTAGSAPYDAAVSRLALAGALVALGRDERAASEVLAARETFERLGAARDLLRAEGAPRRAVMPEALGELTSRELEVLRLVAQGLSDPEIAERLVVSPHTVHRHVANVRSKLRLPSRAAAVAYASRAGLL
ncbi:MAG: LuxR C-terminal-related transcriptional regulator [Thermoleophilaceae bacterium]